MTLSTSAYRGSMDITLCDISAFQYYRIPPCLLRRMVEKIDLSTTGGRQKLAAADAFLGYVDTPVHVLETDRARRFAARGMVKHLWSGELPPGARREIDAYHYVTSPAMTLLMLARHLDATRLTMAVYEMVGTFSVLKMLPGDREHIQQCIDRGQVTFEGGWEPALDERGRLAGDLWARPALLTLDELWLFINKMKGTRGCRALARAAREVVGSAASPFEARSAMRICGSRSRGGEGIGEAELNAIIRFTPAARSIAGHDYAVADMILRSCDGTVELVVECQGKLFHGAGGISMSDANRQLALQCMGYEVIMLTHEQIEDEWRFCQLARYLTERLGGYYVGKNAREMEQQREMRRILFVDWADLLRGAP